MMGTPWDIPGHGWAAELFCLQCCISALSIISVRVEEQQEGLLNATRKARTVLLEIQL